MLFENTHTYLVSLVSLLKKLVYVYVLAVFIETFMKLL